MALISNEIVQAPAFIGVAAAPYLFIADESLADFEELCRKLGDGVKKAA
jgi:hypothetical protein